MIYQIERKNLLPGVLMIILLTNAKEPWMNL